MGKNRDMKWLLALIIAVLMSSLTPISTFAAEVEAGEADVMTAGEDEEVTLYSFDETTGGLTIRSNSATYDWRDTGVSGIDPSRVKSIGLAESVTSVSDYAFAGCSNLESVSFPLSLTEIKASAFRGCTSLKNLELPENVAIIGNRAFRNCISLESIALPKNLSVIVDNAFEKCSSLKSVILPSGIMRVEEEAFEDCIAMKSVIVESETPFTMDDEAFENCSEDLVIYVPKGKEKLFKEAWPELKDMIYEEFPEIEIEPEEVTLKVGESITLEVDIEPEDTEDKTIIWTSSDESVAVVEDGRVTAVSEGETEIKGTLEDGGDSDECKVTVKSSGDSDDDDKDKKIPKTGDPAPEGLLELLAAASAVLGAAIIKSKK